MNSEEYMETFMYLNNMGRKLSLAQYQELVEVVTAGLPEGEDVGLWLLTH